MCIYWRNELAWRINAILFVGATWACRVVHHLRRTMSWFVFKLTLSLAVLHNEQESNAAENQYGADRDGCANSYARGSAERCCMTAWVH